MTGAGPVDALADAPADVLVLCEYPTLNGGERSLLAVLPELARAGFRIRVAAPAAGPLAEELARRQVRHVPFSIRDAAGQALPRDTARSNLRELLADRPALLHANSLSMGRLSGPVVAELGIPSLAHLRDIIGLSAAAVVDLNRHTRLIAVSQATRAFHIAQGIAADKTVAVWNGVDLELFRPRAPEGWLCRELGWPVDACVAGTIGQIILRKGQDVLARAAARLAGASGSGDVERLHWVIVGERHSSKAETIEFERQVHQSFAQAGLAERVRFLGPRDVPPLLGELAMLVHSARQEPLGRVLLEASAAGLPILATDVGGTREILGDECGLLVPPGDDVALAEGMQRLASDPALRQRLGAAARRRAEREFAARLAGEHLAGEYRQVLRT